VAGIFVVLMPVDSLEQHGGAVDQQQAIFNLDLAKTDLAADRLGRKPSGISEGQNQAVEVGTLR